MENVNNELKGYNDRTNDSGLNPTNESRSDSGIELTNDRTGESTLESDDSSLDRTDSYDKTDDSKSNKRVLTGMFRDRDSTENAYKALEEKGYSKDEINVVMSKETRKSHYNDEKTEETTVGTKAADHAGKGSAIGGTVGAIVGVIAAIGTSVVIPGLGILIAGPIAAGLAGAGAGGLAGGIVGALVGSGIPEARAKLYESGIKEGNVVISVTPRNEEDGQYLENNWKANRGEEIHY